jgi:hypothetical protein
MIFTTNRRTVCTKEHNIKLTTGNFTIIIVFLFLLFIYYLILLLFILLFLNYNILNLKAVINNYKIILV